MKAPDNEKNPLSKPRDLLEESSSSELPIWLIVTTKKHIIPQKRLKPVKVQLPHSVFSSSALSICLIVPDPQRAFKDAVADPAVPQPISNRIRRVIDVKKLEKKYHSFESKRLLMESHDLFLADDRIVTYLPKILGKTFYKTTSKRPIPLRLQPTKTKDEKKMKAALPSSKTSKETPDLRSIIPPLQIAHEIERTLNSTVISLSSTATTSIRVGLSTFTSEQLTSNVERLVATTIDKFVPRKWKGVKSIHIKGPNTMALPIWLADELWQDESQVLDEAEVEQAKIDSLSKKKKKRLLAANGQTGGSITKRPAEDGDDTVERKRRKRDQDHGMSQEMKERREKLRQQKKEIRGEMGKKETGKSGNLLK